MHRHQSFKRGPKRRKPKNTKVARKGKADHRHIYNLLGQVANDLGKTREDISEQALIELQKEGKIKEFHRSQPFSKEDKEGCDFAVNDINDNAIKIQVKSSIRGLREFRYNCPHKKQCGEHCKECRNPVIVIKSRVSFARIKEGYERIIFNGDINVIVNDSGVKTLKKVE